MAGFLYYAKGWDAPVTRKQVEAWGLGYAFDAEPQDAEAIAGPSGLGRVFAMLRTMPGKPLQAMKAPEQTWELLLPANETRPELHVGYWSDSRPTPEDLVRSELVESWPVVLEDGNTWQVPVAMEKQGAGRFRRSLPCKMRYEPRLEPPGWVFGEIEQKYAGLWEIAERFDDWIHNAVLDTDDAMVTQGLEPESDDAFDLPATYPRLHEDATYSLATHYRVNQGEVSLLGLFSANNTKSGAMDVLAALIDTQTLVAIEKKKQAAGGVNSSDGPAA